MSAVLRDLWPEDIKSQDVVSPEEILNHQAQQLEARTNGILIAHVTKISAEDRVVLGFEVEAPRVGSRVRLFGAQHRLEFEYPVLILPPDGSLPDYLKERVYRPGISPLIPATLMHPGTMANAMKVLTAATPGTWIENEWVATSPTEFSEKVEAVLGQPFVKAAVLSLLARSNRSGSPPEETLAPTP